MIVKITNRCSMGCTHCMGDYGPEGAHMLAATLKRTVEFIRRVKPRVVVVSGGEPLEHPRAERFIRTIAKSGPWDTIVTTNGMMLCRTLADFLHDVYFQVTNDSRYYPKRPKRFYAPNVEWFDRIPGNMMNIGRAKDNHIKGERTSPTCFNLRSMVRHSKYTLGEAVNVLAGMGKHCTPVVNFDGRITIGELRHCHPVGDVLTSMDNLTERIGKMTCDECGFSRNLPENYHQIVWTAKEREKA